MTQYVTDKSETSEQQSKFRVHGSPHNHGIVTERRKYTRKNPLKNKPVQIKKE